MMNPHFIFNSLGSIQNYLLQRKPREAALYLSQFARLIRQNINASNSAMINLEEEIDRLKNYLDLEKMRMENKFEYRIRVDDKIAAEDALIPSMIIQPFVENSIWHGLRHREKNGLIAISFLLNDEKTMIIVIEDNGVGMKQTESRTSKSERHLGMGVAITRKRLELIGTKYNVRTSVDISESQTSVEFPGTRVGITVPFEYEKQGPFPGR
jgi:LytS/YehU family sensor histidine kinase